MDFTKRYGSLNKAQKKAVDTIEGPVMVIAGPGTGKTELLSVRAANILRSTDTLPENILCLTFTESGASAMRERLRTIIGKDAYKVAIHTFHSFGTEIMNQFSEFFYEGAHFRPADDLSRYEIIHSIFETLGHANVLNKKMNGDYTYLSESLTVISELKKSGLTSDELLMVLDTNDSAIEKAEQLLSPIFINKISKKTADALSQHVDAIKVSKRDVQLPGIVPLATVIADSLEYAITRANLDNSTKPITAWRNQWFKKDDNGKFVMKSHDRQTKLRAMSSMYEQYLSRMEEAELFDFDDMILRVVHAIEIFDELRFNLQEKYQYIMVDEFQDTNMAQMRIVHNLTNNIASGDTPNIMVVGDDDQAIYSFQGADISNIINFRSLYPKTETIALVDNYRSGETILTSARNIITQGTNRLENHIETLNKQLTAHSDSTPASVDLWEFDSSADERHTIVMDIKKKMNNKSDVAVLTRTHSEIEKLLPYFVRAHIPVEYERRDNVLDLPPIVLIEQLSKILVAIYTGRHDDVNGLLPELLAHPVWKIDPHIIWSLSLKAFTDRTQWLHEMGMVPQLMGLQSWLITTALSIPHTPLETMLDIVIGKNDTLTADDEHDDGDADVSTNETLFHSPIYNYYFSDQVLQSQPDEYIRYLEGLRAIRSKLRDYRPLETPNLISFIDFIGLHRAINSGITSLHTEVASESVVHLMTAHKSKGLEFDTVYITGAIDSSWGQRARSFSRLLTYPENLQISPSGDSADERLRLFYVAVTRAKNHLVISYANHNDSLKSTEGAGFLLGESWQPQLIKSPNHNAAALETAEVRWYEHITSGISSQLKTLLSSQLDTYQLSVTHLTNFLDVTRGGPQNFLLQNLLRFPQAMSPASAYGSAVHQTLQRAHVHLISHGERQAIEDILHNFEKNLEEHHLSSLDYEFYLQKGSQELQSFLDNRYMSFSKLQKTELNFKSQHVVVGDAHLSGAIDLIDINTDKTVKVTDYKTGKPARSWTGKTEYEKIKLHKYKQQLMFYKLLIEHARDYRGHIVSSGVLQFIEPSSVGNIVDLETGFSDSEQQEFITLINAVWKRIITLDLPDVSSYDQTFKGILQFEQDLIDDTVHT
jgi:DNA helicase-2/ATP-dependent DNA helicase PcrA